MTAFNESNVAYVDTETTGLDPNVHEVWEVAAIVDGREYRWFLDADVSTADPFALEIGRYHERHPNGNRFVPGVSAMRRRDSPEGWEVWPAAEFARAFARLTDGRHLVGAIPSFDEERLRWILLEENVRPTWHYHLIDVESLAVGYLACLPNVSGDYARAMHTDVYALPWKSENLSRAIGVDPDEFDRHTALGDASWARAICRAIFGSRETLTGAQVTGLRNQIR